MTRRRLSPALAGELCLLEWAAGAALRRQASRQTRRSRRFRSNKEDRAGLLSHPYLMASFAYTATSSPIHRGVFIARSVLGRVLRPPPEAVAPLAPDLHPDLTTRQRVSIQTTARIMPVLPRHDQSPGIYSGAFRRPRSISKRGEGQADRRHADRTKPDRVRPVKFSGVRDLAAYLTTSGEAHSAFVQQLFHYLVKQPIGAFGPQELPELRRFFVAHDFNIRKLMAEIMASSALTPRGREVVESRKHAPVCSPLDQRTFRLPLQFDLPAATKSPDCVDSTPEKKHGAPKQPTRVHPRPGNWRGSLAVRPELTEPGLCESTAAKAAAGRDVQPQWRRALGVLARRGRSVVQAQREPEAARTVPRSHVDPARCL